MRVVWQLVSTDEFAFICRNKQTSSSETPELNPTSTQTDVLIIQADHTSRLHQGVKTHNIC